VGDGQSKGGRLGKAGHTDIMGVVPNAPHVSGEGKPGGRRGLAVAATSMAAAGRGTAPSAGAWLQPPRAPWAWPRPLGPGGGGARSPAVSDKERGGAGGGWRLAAGGATEARLPPLPTRAFPRMPARLLPLPGPPPNQPTPSGLVGTRGLSCLVTQCQCSAGSSGA
jgi:hypothetical protein